jgi:hypothetical protein
MRKIALRNLAIGCFAAVSLAPAQTTWTSVGPFVIAELKSDFTPSEGIVVAPPAGFTIPNPGSCAATDGGGLISTNKAYTTQSALILAAFLGGKQVKLWFASNAGCAVNRPAFAGLDVLK